MSAPSPHRFVPKNQSRARNTKPSSSLYKQLPQTHEEISEETQQTVPAVQQFAQTPRFSLGHTPTRAGRASSPSSATRSLPPVLIASAPSREEVEETLSSQSQDAHDGNGEDDEMLLGNEEETQAIPTTESTQSDLSDWTTDLPHSPKRRRLDASHEATDCHATPNKVSFQMPAVPTSGLKYIDTTPRFIRGQSVVDREATSETHQRPMFLPPSDPPSEPAGEPLPEAFSPQRRGQKFVPGGMAATVQQWIIQASQSATMCRRGDAYLKGKDYVLQLAIDQICGRGPFLVHCTETPSNRRHKLLLSENSKVSADDLKPGSKIGIKPPTWDVDGLEGGTWSIGVDWRLLS